MSPSLRLSLSLSLSPSLRLGLRLSPTLRLSLSLSLSLSLLQAHQHDWRKRHADLAKERAELESDRHHWLQDRYLLALTLDLPVATTGCRTGQPYA